MVKSLGRFRAFPPFSDQIQNCKQITGSYKKFYLTLLTIFKIIHSETVNLVGAAPRPQNKSPCLFFFVY